MQCLLYEFPQSPAILHLAQVGIFKDTRFPHLVDFSELVIDRFFRVKVPDVNPEIVLLNTCHIQHKVLIPSRTECLGLVAGVAPSVRIGRQEECAEGVALAGHVLPYKVPCTVHLQVNFEIRLLNRDMLLAAEM